MDGLRRRHEPRELCPLPGIELLDELGRRSEGNLELEEVAVRERADAHRHHHPLPFFQAHMLEAEDVEILRLLAIRSACISLRCGRHTPSGPAGHLRHHRVGVEVAEVMAVVEGDRLRETCRRLLQADRVGGTLQGERGDTDNEIAGDVVEVDQIVDERRLEPDAGLPLAVELDSVRRNPAEPALDIHQADTRFPFRKRRDAVPRAAADHAEGERAAKLLAAELRGRPRTERDVLDARKRQDAGAGVGPEEDEIGGDRQLGAVAGRRERFKFLRALHRRREDRRLVGDRIAVGRRDLGDEHLRAGIGVDELLERERRSLDPDPALRRGDGGQPDPLVGRAGPERPHHRGREMTENGVPFGIDRDAAPMDNEGVAILEDAHLADREGGLRLKGGLRREIGPPRRQRQKQEETEEVDSRRPEDQGKVGGIGSRHRRPLNSGNRFRRRIRPSHPPGSCHAVDSSGKSGNACSVRDSARVQTRGYDSAVLSTLRSLPATHAIPTGLDDQPRAGAATAILCRPPALPAREQVCLPPRPQLPGRCRGRGGRRRGDGR